MARKKAREREGSMSGRRSSRQKRTVDYRKFADRVSDDDDDFESSPVLPRKAVRGEQGTGRGSKPGYTPMPTAAGTSQKALTESPKKDSSGDVGPPPKKARQSLDERQFSKDTDTALRESAMDASSPNVTSAHKLKDTEYKPPGDGEEEEEEYFSEGDVSSDSDFNDAGPQLSKGGVRKNKKPAGRGSHSTAVGTTTRQQKSVSKKAANTIGVETENKLKTAVPTAKTVLLTPTALSSPSVSSSPRLGVRKMPKWTPPGPANRENNCRDHLGSTERTGGTPLIRVGLSRKARVKPLHNSSHVPHL
jgi:hypothetical protein